MAKDLDPRDELEIQAMHEAQNEYGTNLRDDLKARLKARLDAIDHLEDLLHRCGRESADALLAAQRRRDLRQDDAQITATRQTILKLATDDEELKDIVSTYSTSHKISDAIEETRKVVAHVAHRMIRLYRTAQSGERANTILTKCNTILSDLSTHAEQLSKSLHRLSGFEDADTLSMLLHQDVKWQSAVEGLRWSTDYLIARLEALDLALKMLEYKPKQSKTGFAHNLLAYPFMDVHFFTQNVAALADLNFGRQRLELSRIAYFFTVQADAIDEEQSEEDDEDEEELENEANSIAHDIEGNAREATEIASQSDKTAKEQAEDKNGEKSGECQADKDHDNDNRNDDAKTLSTDKPPKVIIKHSQTYLNTVGQHAEAAVRDRVALLRSANVHQWRDGTYLSSNQREALRTFSHVLQDAKAGSKDESPSKKDAKVTGQSDGNIAQTPANRSTQLQSQTFVPNEFAPRLQASPWLLPPFCTLPLGTGFPTNLPPMFPQADKKPASGMQVEVPRVVTTVRESEHEDEVREAAMVAFSPAKFNTDNASLLTKATRISSTSIMAEDLKYPIHIAIKRHDQHSLEQILRNSNEDVNARNHRGKTPLETAIEICRDHPGIIRALLKAGADITLPSRWVPNALFHVLRDLEFQLALMFADEAQDAMTRVINEQDSEGLTPLLLVVQWKSPTHYPVLPVDDEPSFLREDLCLRFIDLGADVTLVSKDTQLTALHFAARYGELNLVERFIVAGGDVNAADCLGRTPLHEAVMVGYLPDVVASLMIAGADPYRANEHGVTPVELALAWEKMAKEGLLSYKHSDGLVNITVPIREVERLREILVPRSTRAGGEKKDDRALSARAETELMREATIRM